MKDKFNPTMKSRIITMELLGQVLGGYSRKYVYKQIQKYEEETGQKYNQKNCVSVIAFVRWHDVKKA